jgi:hypothetical protein
VQQLLLLQQQQQQVDDASLAAKQKTLVQRQCICCTRQLSDLCDKCEAVEFTRRRQPAAIKR